VLTIYRRLLELLTPRERRRFWLLCVMIFAMGLLELAGVASIVPFLAVLSDPEIIRTNAVLAGVVGVLGLTTTESVSILLGVFTFAFILLGAGLKSATLYALFRFSHMREYALSSRLLAIYLRQPYAWFLGRHSAALGTRVLSEVGEVATNVFIPALRLLAFGTVATLLALFLVVTEPLVAIGGGLIIGGGYAALFTISRRFLARSGADRMAANAERFRIAQESLGGVKYIKLLGLEDRYLGRFRDPAERFARHQALSRTISQTPRFLLEALVFGVMVIFVLVMLLLAEKRLDQMLPLLGMFAFGGARLMLALQQVYQSMTQLRFTRPALDALYKDYVERSATTTSAAPDATPRRLRRRIEFVDVRYTYPGADQSALDGLEMTIPANTTVGLVGASGAGKTTAVDVLLGLLVPEHGALVVDGETIDGRNLRSWQQRLGYVPQEIFLTDDSVAANIALGMRPEEIDMAAVERAARIAELHDVVRKDLPQGYDTRLGERGVRLSGGQRQRIGIARALYHDPDVLILDEATSALDNLTERAVIQAVHNLAHAKTIVMIAHRLTTVKACDTIFLLERGRCVAAGAYDELLARNPSFRELATATA
jgi:ABC-type multidrug transport system fused ATPase/permease subunit